MQIHKQTSGNGNFFLIFATQQGGFIIMREPIQQLNTSNITSEVFVIAPTQLDFIAQIFADNVADAMNLRTFAPKIRQIATQSLRTALSAARHAGEK